MQTTTGRATRIGFLILCPLWAGADECTSKTTCEYGGEHKPLGDSFPSSDGCNTCSCTRDGVECTARACADGTCTYDGTLYHSGETFAATDGCNTCSCEAGVVSCTEEGCTPIECEHGGQTYAVGAVFDDDDNCNQCTCMEDGFVVCTAKDCVCFSPNSFPELALTDPDAGCSCDEAPSVCVTVQDGNRPHDLALVCWDGRWQSAEDGPCGDFEHPGCRVEGVDYAHGAGVPDPFSCNTCICSNGQVEACTEIGCADPCPDGTAPGTHCAECGPVDECLAIETGCLPVCDEDADCTGRACIEGLCRNLCG